GVAGDHHRRAGLARRRAFRRRDDDEHGVAVARERGGEGIDPAHLDPYPRERRSSTAARTRSGVAGADSRGKRVPSATLAIASRNAWNAESASISGGSPTAFERWIVSSRFGSPKSAMSKCVGTSRDVGILY